MNKLQLNDLNGIEHGKKALSIAYKWAYPSLLLTTVLIKYFVAAAVMFLWVFYSFASAMATNNAYQSGAMGEVIIGVLLFCIAFFGFGLLAADTTPSIDFDMSEQHL